RALRLPWTRCDELPHLPADVDAGDRARRVAPDALPDDERPDGLRDDPDRPHHVQHQLRRRDREGAARRLRPPPRRGGDGPLRERAHDVPEGDTAADRTGNPGRVPARVRALGRRLRDYELQCGSDRDVPALRLGGGARWRTAPDQRDRDGDLRDRRRRHARQRALAARASDQERGVRGMAVTSPVQLDRQRIKELTEREAARLNERTVASQRMFERARKVLAGGVASSYQLREPWPIYLSHGEGQCVWDVDGNRMFDFHNGFGSMTQGHAHPAISRAVSERAPRGTHFAAPTEDGVWVAEELVRRFGLPKWRYTNSGSES